MSWYVSVNKAKVESDKNNNGLLTFPWYRDGRLTKVDLKMGAVRRKG